MSRTRSIGTIALVVSDLLYGCRLRSPDTAPTYNAEVAKSRLRAGATELLTAMKRGDTEGVIDRMPQPLLSNTGREHIRKDFKETREDMKRQGVEIAEIRLLDTSELILRGDVVYAIQQYQGEFAAAHLEEGVYFGYLVCISENRGKDWTFIDGTLLNGDREKLKRPLPQFPDELQLPTLQPPRIKPKRK